MQQEEIDGQRCHSNSSSGNTCHYRNFDRNYKHERLYSLLSTRTRNPIINRKPLTMDNNFEKGGIAGSSDHIKKGRVSTGERIINRPSKGISFNSDIVRATRTGKTHELALWMVEKLNQGKKITLHSETYPKDMIERIRKLGIDPTITHGLTPNENEYDFKLK